jgi:hypothetical protein
VITFTVDERPELYDQRFILRMFSGKKCVAYVTYVVEDEHEFVIVAFVKAHKKRKGYGTQVMKVLYEMYPEHLIDWGPVNEKSVGMAENFYDAYPDRTAYCTLALSH